MLRLLAQPQKELQLDLKTNKTQHCQKIELYRNLTTKDLKKQHSFRRVGGMESQTGREVQRCGVLWRSNSSGRTDSPTFTYGG